MGMSWSRVALRRQLEAQAFAIDMISNETMCQLSKLSAEAPRQLKLSLRLCAACQCNALVDIRKLFKLLVMRLLSDGDTFGRASSADG
eukprot:5014031-Amphidinium_carterae.2